MLRKINEDAGMGETGVKILFRKINEDAGMGETSVKILFRKINEDAGMATVPKTFETTCTPVDGGMHTMQR